MQKSKLNRKFEESGHQTNGQIATCTLYSFISGRKRTEAVTA